MKNCYPAPIAIDNLAQNDSTADLSAGTNVTYVRFQGSLLNVVNNLTAEPLGLGTQPLV